MQRVKSFEVEHEAPARYPALPEGMQRGDWLDLVDEVAKPLGLGASARMVLRVMVNATRPRDWTSGVAAPICFMAQSKIVEKSGLSPAAVRRHQVALEERGLLARHLGANGARSSHKQLGLFFDTGIAMLPDLLELRDSQRAEQEQAARLRGLRSVHKGILARLIEALAEAGAPLVEVQQHARELASWPRADALHAMPLSELDAHVAMAAEACSAAEDSLEILEKSSGQPLKNERPHIQDTTQDPSYEVRCNASVTKRSEGKPSHSDLEEARPVGRSCREKDDEISVGSHKSEFLEKLSPARLYNLASEEMQLWLDMARRDRSIDQLRLQDLVVAADRRVPELGINASAWRGAMETMGPDAAALCVMIIDANRTAAIPVQNPGGYLRAMTARHRAGTLNIVGSLIGLSERRRMEAEREA